MRKQKFTTTLNKQTIDKLQILKGFYELSGMNETIEKLVNEKYQEIEPVILAVKKMKKEDLTEKGVKTYELEI